MEHKKSLFDQALEHLASIPNLRKILQSLWISSTLVLGLALLLEGILIFSGKKAFRLEWLKSLVLWAGVNPLFAYVLYCWKKKEFESK